MIIKVEDKSIEEMGEITCKKCGCISTPAYKYVKSNNSIQARCKECDAFIKNVKQIEVMSLEKPTESQISYINHFYNTKQIPKTKERATQLIHILKKVSDDYEL
jgi:hypothetical protein